MHSTPPFRFDTGITRCLPREMPSTRAASIAGQFDIGNFRQNKDSHGWRQFGGVRLGVQHENGQACMTVKPSGQAESRKEGRRGHQL